MAAKYKEFFDLMIQNNEKVFEDFRELHDRYALDPNKLQEEFNLEGSKIMRIIREWEDKLCSRSEGSGYGQYSANLADKFQAEVRKHFPEIDKVGIKIFSLKQIRLS